MPQIDFSGLIFIMNDLRFALRQLAKHPGYSVVVVLTLALGIAVNTAIFGMINVYFLQRMPVPAADRLVLVLQRSDAWKMPHGISYQDFKDYRERVTTVTDLIAFVPNPAHLSAEGRSPERAYVEVVTSNAFSAMGVQAQLGRMLVPADGETAGGAPIVVLSHTCWQDRFGGDPDIVNRAVVLNGRTFTVVGVAAEGFKAFTFGMVMSGWVPTSALDSLNKDGAGLLEWRSAPIFKVMGRRAPGTSLDEVRAEMAVIEKQIATEHPDSHHNTQSVVIPENQARPDPSVAEYLPIFAAIFVGLVGLVMCIACANVANLMMSRAAARQKELTMRAALGASRTALIRQLLVESMLLAVIAGVVGWYLAGWLGMAMAHFAPQGDMPVDMSYETTWIDHAFIIAISLIAGFTSGIVPAWRASRIDLIEDLKESSGGRASPMRHRLRNTLVIGQVTFSLVVLIGAGLFLRSLQRVGSLDLGFKPDNLLLVSFDLSLQRYTPERADAFQRQLLERVNALPGVVAASIASHVPFDYQVAGRTILLENPPPEMVDGSTSVSISYVSPGYIEMMGLRMRSGRTIAATDTAESPQVAVVNDAMARVCWPGQDAIGKRFRPWKDGPWIEVVGVTETAKYVMLAEPPRPYFYGATPQFFAAPLSLLVRTSGEPTTQTNAIRAAVTELDPHLPVFNVRTMDDLMGSSIFALMPMRMGAMLASVQGAVGLLLAVMGLYAVVSFGVTQRTREIGIRIALGALPADVIRSVLREGMRLTLIGLGTGIVIASLLGFGMSKVLYGLDSFDPVAVFGVSLLLGGTSLLACWIPARRATQVNPITALRAE